MAKTRFDLCLDEVLRHEGGYADHPNDPGGATNMGITRKTLARWRKVSPWWDLPKSAVKAMARSEAATIYRASYWDVSRAGSLPAGVDLALFDFAVNSGPYRAIRSLQSVLGVVADGRVGPLTLDAARLQTAKAGAGYLIDALCDRRLSFLQKLSTFPTFGKGWSVRVAAVRKASKAAVAEPAPDLSILPRSTIVDIFNGYKTYIVAALMLLAGLGQAMGIEVPTLDGSASGHLIMEALALIFLRKGLKGDIGRA